MIRTLGLTLAAGLLLGVAPAARAQLSVTVGGRQVYGTPNVYQNNGYANNYGYGTTGYGTTGYGTTGYGTTGYGTTAYAPYGYGTTGYGTTSYGTNGYAPYGYGTTGYAPSTGYYNSGYSGYSGVVGSRTTTIYQPAPQVYSYGPTYGGYRQVTPGPAYGSGSNAYNRYGFDNGLGNLQQTIRGLR